MRILFATDLSERAEHAAELIKSTSWPSGTVVRVISVIEPYSTLVGLTPETVVEFDDLSVREVRKALEKLADTLRKPGVTIESEVLVGRPADQIVVDARDFKADVVVMSSRGRGPFATTLLGSVSAEVVDRSPCPVLVARNDSLRKIVLGDDGSEGASYAADVLHRLPFFKSVEATVVSVVESTTPWALGTEPTELSPAATEAFVEAVEALRQRAAKDAKAMAEKLTKSGIRASGKVREGHAASELVAEAEETGADTIVVGSRGHTGLARLVLGSAARSVLTHAHCSVLVVHKPELEVKDKGR